MIDPRWHGPLLTPTATSHSERGQRTEATSSGRSSQGEFGISCAKWRVGAPPLRPQPIVTLYDRANIHLVSRFEGEFKERAEIILATYGIDISDYNADFVNRCIRGEKCTGELTLHINAQWTEQSPTIWVNIVRELKSWIDDRLHETGYDKEGVTAAVEMIDPEVDSHKQVAPVLNRPDLERDWPGILDSVHKILESFDQTRSHMTSISLFHFGSSWVPEWDPITVYVSVDYECPESTWPPVIQAIRKYIKDTMYRLHIHMEHNLPQDWTFPLLPSTLNDVESDSEEKRLRNSIRGDYQATVNMGAEISPSRYITRDDGKKCNTGYGTLGCYVEVKTKEKPEWTKFGLTSYHVVRSALEGYRLNARVPTCLESWDPSTTFSRLVLTAEDLNFATKSELVDPPPGSDLWRSDREGFRPTSPASRYPLEHPARISHNFTVSVERKGIAIFQAEGPPAKHLPRPKRRSWILRLPSLTRSAIISEESGRALDGEEELLRTAG